MSSYYEANEIKATFDDVYTAPTPHAYVGTMAKHGYEIGEQARPYCAAVADLLRDRNTHAWAVQMLDVGCSYGIGSAFVKHGCTFDEMVAYFSSRAPTEYHAACEATRVWLSLAPPACDVRSVGLDSSEPAIRFAVDAGLLDGGIARDFEDPNQTPTEEDRAWFRSCNLLISTGAIGYVTDRTFDVVVRDFGADHPGRFGPIAVMTILRMFASEPIQRVFEKHGFQFGAVPGVRLPQRRFIDDRERLEVLTILENQGIDTRGWEDQGKQFADLYVAAPPEQFPAVLEQMLPVQADQENRDSGVTYIHR